MFSSKRIFSMFVTALGLTALLAMAAVADPPSRVARINYLQGSVSLQRGDLDEWNPAILNYPIVASDSLWTDNQARAELHIGSTAIRLSDQTSISFLNLNDRVVQIRLAEGTVEVNLHRLDSGETYEIDTPGASISLLGAGDYRLDVDDDGNATVITRHGQAEVTTGNAVFAVNTSQQAYVINTDGSAYELFAAKPPNDFEQWAEERTQREEQSASAQYVSREMTGYEDLDAYGSWTVLPNYGNAWAPYNVAAGWTPYSVGNWLWSEPYGWTWVDVEPWGFAPFHYGRWAFVSSRWYWMPGPLIARPIFAPALVGFVGGGNWGVSLGFGNAIGWFPLGPGEFYRPAYVVSERYVRGLNPWVGRSVTNVYVTNRFVNRTVPGGITVVSRESFTGGRNVLASRVSVEPRVLAEAPIVGATAPVAPVRASLLARTGRAGFVARPPDSLRDRIVRTKTAPAPAAVPFAARQQALASSPGRPLDSSALNQIRGQIRGTTPNRQVQGVMPVRPSSPQLAPPERTAPNISRPALPNGPGEFEHRAMPEQRSTPPVAPAPEQHLRPQVPIRPSSPPVVRPNNPPAFRLEHVQPMRPPQQRIEHGNGFNPHHDH